MTKSAQINMVCTTLRGGLDDDNRLAAQALSAAGYEVSTVFWDDPTQEWDEEKIYINRCTYDYHLSPQKFRDWLDYIESKSITLLNSPELIRDNISKSYLTKYPEAVPTQILMPCMYYKLYDLRLTRNNSIIIKPLIGASGHLLYRVSKDTPETIIRDIISAYQAQPCGGMMIQPFIKSVLSEGEYSLIFFNNQFSHTLIKRPAQNDYRVQAHFGGRTHLYKKTPKNIIAQALKILSRLPDVPLYARLDGFIENDRFLLSEIEVNEAYLWFNQTPFAIELFTQAVNDRLYNSTYRMVA